jgi:ATP-binding cassette, subfamily D (ALD), peroxisomal long-chain fatty acid import protein
MFLPQRPYLSSGTLRDQIIYPDTEPDFLARGHRDRDLLKILEMARLEYLPGREGGYDTRKEWKDVLSGGEKQRMGFARVIYHEPRYVVIDEGTSAVSSDVEGWLYEMLKERGITLITISTRASLKKYHSFVLTLGAEDEDLGGGDEARLGSGTGYGWKWERVGSEQQKMGVARELAELKERLAKVEGWKRRLEEIKGELAKVWTEGGEELVRPEYGEGDGEGKKQAEESKEYN